jgi:very-short-patch-repair endonuclease
VDHDHAFLLQLELPRYLRMHDHSAGEKNNSARNTDVSFGTGASVSKLEDSFFEELGRYRLPEPERQFKFHPKRQWKLDFAWPDMKIAVEIHGGIHAAKRWHHSSGSQQEKDFEKANAAARAGWRVFVFGPKACYVPKSKRLCSEALRYMSNVLMSELDRRKKL